MANVDIDGITRQWHLSLFGFDQPSLEYHIATHFDQFKQYNLTDGPLVRDNPPIQGSMPIVCTPAYVKLTKSGDVETPAFLLEIERDLQNVYEVLLSRQHLKTTTNLLPLVNPEMLHGELKFARKYQRGAVFYHSSNNAMVAFLPDPFKMSFYHENLKSKHAPSTHSAAWHDIMKKHEDDFVIKYMDKYKEYIPETNKEQERARLRQIHTRYVKNGTNQRLRYLVFIHKINSPLCHLFDITGDDLPMLKQIPEDFSTFIKDHPHYQHTVIPSQILFFSPLESAYVKNRFYMFTEYNHTVEQISNFAYKFEVNINLHELIIRIERNLPKFLLYNVKLLRISMEAYQDYLRSNFITIWEEQSGLQGTPTLEEWHKLMPRVRSYFVENRIDLIYDILNGVAGTIKTKMPKIDCAFQMKMSNYKPLTKHFDELFRFVKYNKECLPFYFDLQQQDRLILAGKTCNDQMQKHGVTSFKQMVLNEQAAKDALRSLLVSTANTIEKPLYEHLVGNLYTHLEVKYKAYLHYLAHSHRVRDLFNFARWMLLIYNKFEVLKFEVTSTFREYKVLGIFNETRPVYEVTLKPSSSPNELIKTFQSLDKELLFKAGGFEYSTGKLWDFRYFFGYDIQLKLHGDNIHVDDLLAHSLRIVDYNTSHKTVFDNMPKPRMYEKFLISLLCGLDDNATVKAVKASLGAVPFTSPKRNAVVDHLWSTWSMFYHVTSDSAYLFKPPGPASLNKKWLSEEDIAEILQHPNLTITQETRDTAYLIAWYIPEGIRNDADVWATYRGVKTFRWLAEILSGQVSESVVPSMDKFVLRDDHRSTWRDLTVSDYPSLINLYVEFSHFMKSKWGSGHNLQIYVHTINYYTFPTLHIHFRQSPYTAAMGRATRTIFEEQETVTRRYNKHLTFDFLLQLLKSQSTHLPLVVYDSLRPST